MKPIKLDDFYKHTYLSALTYAPSGKRAAYIVKTGDPKENKYNSDIYMYDKGAHTRMTTEGDVKFFAFIDERTIIFAATRGKLMEESEKKGNIFTAFFRLDILSKKASKLFTLPIQASDIRPIGKDQYLLQAEIDLSCPDFYLLDQKEQKKVVDRNNAEKDYEVLEESPFWYNGRGFISGKRGALFLYNAKKERLTRINSPEIDVSGYTYDNEYVYYFGEDRKPEMKDRHGVYSYSLTNGTKEQVLNDRFCVYSIHSLGDKLILIGTDQKRYGGSENPYFYLIDKKTGNTKVLNPADESMGHGVLTDVTLGATRSTKVDGDYLYFAATDRYATHLKRIDLDGDIETVVKREGALIDFDVMKGNIMAIGMYDMKLPEIYENKKDDLVCISNYNDAILDGKYVAEPQYLSVQSEGFDIDGWVLLPIDYDPNKTYPAILDIHGGPKCAYGPVYFHEMQAWASAGYFVFFCNPTGSDGRGNAFADIRLKWGGPD
ncbi:MAG: prolyl oligopeptidase family serine peptidase, partial [Bacilli bacterium]|nr:prolyl oligopeptidase family serine peptidase [Bacilli bacterium]